MAYIQPQAPHVNGVMDLIEEEATTIKTKLITIQDAFVPTEEQPVLDLFYTVATYNKENPDTPINGDTARAILATEEATAIEGDVVNVEIVG